MQTFLPYSDYEQTARCLDNLRLGKQRVECLQILNVLLLGKKSWANHPAVKMWKGYETSLICYGQQVCMEWMRRGFKDNCFAKITGHVISGQKEIKPIWLVPELHASHRSNLLRKEPDWYGKFGWTESPDMPYWWPTKNGF